MPSENADQTVFEASLPEGTDQGRSVAPARSPYSPSPRNHQTLVYSPSPHSVARDARRRTGPNASMTIRGQHSYEVAQRGTSHHSASMSANAQERWVDVWAKTTNWMHPNQAGKEVLDEQDSNRPCRPSVDPPRYRSLTPATRSALQFDDSSGYSGDAYLPCVGAIRQLGIVGPQNEHGESHVLLPLI